MTADDDCAIRQVSRRSARRKWSHTGIKGHDWSGSRGPNRYLERFCMTPESTGRLLIPKMELQADKIWSDQKILVCLDWPHPDELLTVARVRVFDIEHAMLMKTTLLSSMSWTTSLTPAGSVKSKQICTCYAKKCPLLRKSRTSRQLQAHPAMVEGIPRCLLQRSAQDIHQEMRPCSCLRFSNDASSCTEVGNICKLLGMHSNRSFKTKTGLGVHMRKRHSKFACAAAFTPTTRCLRCNREYHTRPRVVQHLEFGSPDCLAWLQKRSTNVR